MKHTRGFTLVELAIVLVIIGLIVGAVLAGATLIRNAEMRAVIQEKNTYEAAINTFRTKYDGLPGDIPNITATWGAVDPDPANCLLNNTSDLPTCNGSGNKRIADAFQNGSVEKTTEIFTVWEHLGNAGLINGSFTGTVGAGGMIDAVAGVNFPGSKVDGGIWFIEDFGNVTAAVVASHAGESDSFFLTNYGQTILLGSPKIVPTYGGIPFGPLFTTAETYALDMKMDDGKPGTGVLKTMAPLATGNPFDNACATSTDPMTAEYDSNTDGAECSLMFKLKI